MNKIITFWKKGDSYILLTAGGLLFSLAMVIFMISIILIKGFGSFYVSDVAEIKMKDNTIYLAEILEKEEVVLQSESGKSYKQEQTNIKIANRDIFDQDFKWINSQEISKIEYPQNVTVFERWEYGNLIAYVRNLNYNGKVYLTSDKDFWDTFSRAFEKSEENKSEKENLEEELNDVLSPVSEIQREIALMEINFSWKTKEIEKLKQEEGTLQAEINFQIEQLNKKIEQKVIENSEIYAIVQSGDGTEITLELEKVYRFCRPNDMNFIAKSGLYLTKIWEYLVEDPRESNTEGGVFPAIFGTVMMVILMSIAVVPFGVLAALYLNEYAKQGFVTRLIRLAIANLAGVPSIVYGIFGLGFFIYFLGGTIDQLLFSSKLPEPTFGTGGILWASLTLALLTLPVVVVATEEGILAVPKANKDGALALGATKWQMIRKIVLPNAMPGILTGVILAISRGAGEVAPLMITGVVKLAPTLPFDTSFPFLHLDRKFMHLGFHIYDVGFQSPNVEASLPMVYTTALLLIFIVITLNLSAIFLRNYLRKKFKTSAF